MGTAAFATAALFYGLYFASAPAGFQRIPRVVDHSSEPFVLLLFSYLHVALVALLPHEPREARVGRRMFQRPLVERRAHYRPRRALLPGALRAAPHGRHS